MEHLERFKRVEIGIYESTSEKGICVESFSNDEWANIIALSKEEAEWLSVKLMEYAKKLSSSTHINTSNEN